eukprot:CAMPEP_0179169420 /NCGR_PEP_ID=MMETSP0796-20121207/83388_1 /TAXON_ID=73915 /ORGANISM="Pyrodinium bahamense, Strain pbaha01" /LENGTH=36 /DNA_ID= /DNA_START= /DNA_END= /DNA_ORIENTATION=
MTNLQGVMYNTFSTAQLPPRTALLPAFSMGVPSAKT